MVAFWLIHRIHSFPFHDEIWQHLGIFLSSAPECCFFFLEEKRKNFAISLSGERFLEQEVYIRSLSNEKPTVFPSILCDTKQIYWVKIWKSRMCGGMLRQKLEKDMILGVS